VASTPEFGTLTPLSPATVSTSGLAPISLVVSPDGKSAYVGSEKGNSVSEFARDTTTGRLTPLAPATIEAGLEPRTVAISPDGKSVYATNFAGNNVSQFSRNAETGVLTTLGPAVGTDKQPHGIGVSPDGKSVYVANYGAGTISQLSRNVQTGALTPLVPATLRAGSNPNGIAISPDGKSVYTANRGSKSISEYRRNTQSGLLTVLSPATVEAGEKPHDIAISPDGKSVYVPDAAESSKPNTLSQFSRNAATGVLTALSPATVSTAGEARGVTVSPDGSSVYVANGTQEVVSQYSRDPTSGSLTQLSPPTVAAGNSSYSVTASPDGKSVYVTNEGGKNISQYARLTTTNPARTFTTAAPPIIAPSPPSVGNARESHRIWRERGKLAVITRRKPPVGTTFSFSLNEQASVTLAFTQLADGRKVRGKCVAQTKANQHKRACKRTVTRGTLTFTGHADTNKVAFQGRISPSKKLLPGKYALVISATNAAGQRSSAKPLTFTIVR
jgi:DNA-binding beta-propeller fold protein YncE